MNEINRILKLFYDLQQGDCWIGNSFKDTLEGVAAPAAAQPVKDGTNSAWQLVVHINYWRTSVINRINGSLASPPFADFTLPAVLNEESWRQSLRDFESVYQQLYKAIQDFPLEDLDNPSPRIEQTFYQLIMGCLQHDAYHLGQLAFIKKCISGNT